MKKREEKHERKGVRSQVGLVSGERNRLSSRISFIRNGNIEIKEVLKEWKKGREIIYKIGVVQNARNAHAMLFN